MSNKKLWESELLFQSNKSIVMRSILPGNIRIITEKMNFQDSATLGIWVTAGSRHENIGEYGSAHFLEHLLFKGTHKNSNIQIAEAFDKIGGECNAITTKEYTCYYAKILSKDLFIALDILGDMICNSILDPREIENERKVILEEIAMDNDDSSNLIHDMFAKAVLNGSDLARPIGGTEETVSNLSRLTMLEFYKKFYKPKNIIITAAGNVDHNIICEQVFNIFSLKWNLEKVYTTPDKVSIINTSCKEVDVNSQNIQIERRKLEQAHIIMGSPSVVATDNLRYIIKVLNVILGCSVSSRLFQEIREKRGLAYSINSFATHYSDAGYFGMYAACIQENTLEIIKLMRRELEKLASNKFSATDHELRKAKGQIAGNTILSLEDNSSRMFHLGSNEIIFGKYFDINNEIENTEAVTKEQIKEMAYQICESKKNVLTILGPCKNIKSIEKFMKK